MLKSCCFFLLLLLALVSCNQNASRKNYFKALSPDSLLLQRFSVDNTRDTILRTINGALLAIEKGSFTANAVQLEIKETYTISSMILAGLTTQSDGRLLSSGGMISVQARDRAVGILKPISISLPTDTVDPQMQLFRGRKNKDGNINWEDPQPLKKDNLTGQLLFKQFCTTCHGLDKILSGPALRGVEARGPWTRPNLISWVKNPARFIPRTCYTQKLQRQYGQVMPGFSHLNDREIEAIFDYIRDEDGKGTVYQNTYDPVCDDSCYRYDSLRLLVEERLSRLESERADRVWENGDRINLDMKLKLPDLPLNNDGVIVTSMDSNKVLPRVYPSEFYQFRIKTFGWYNVDKLLDYSKESVDLSVQTKGDFEKNMSVFLVVPEYRIFAEGGPLNGSGNLFGFYTTDGRLPLPPGTKVIVFAVGEINGDMAFDWKEFVSVEKQNIVLEPRITDKKDFNRTVKKFKLDDINIKADDSKNAKIIRKIDKETGNIRRELERLRPKNCDCHCLNPSDSIQSESAN